jgi:O-antigen ligase
LIFTKHPDERLQWEWHALQWLCLTLPLNAFFTALLAIVLILVFVAKHGFKCLQTPVNWGWLGFALILGITTLTAEDVGGAAIGLLNFYPFLMLFAIASVLIYTARQQTQILWLLVLSLIPISLFGLLQVILNQPEWKLPRLFNSYEITLGMGYENRITSLFGHPNELATYAILLLPVILHFALGRVKSHRGRLQTIAAIALALDTIMLIFAQARNTWGVGFIGLVIQGIYYQYWWLVGGVAVLTTGAIWSASVLGIGRTSLVEFISANNLRLEIYDFCWQLIQQRPWQGWGLRSFLLLSDKFGFPYKFVVHEHNLFLAIALGSGIPALVMFLGMLGWLITDGVRWADDQELRPLVVISSLCLILFLLTGFYDTSHYEIRVFALFWLLASIVGSQLTSPKPLTYDLE